MKKKVGTILDEKLLLKVKQVALSQEQTLSQLLEDALNIYLLTIDKNKERKNKNITQSTRGAMKISRTALKTVMEEEGVYETG